MEPTGPLAGVRVLELCHFLAGPYAALALADLGADVVKVEDPDHPDEARGVGPCFTDQSVYFESLNWGKRSLGLRITDPEGYRLLLEVVRKADVVLDNFKPGVMASLKLDHASLAAVNPKIISCSLSGFGASGPLTSRAGYDYTIQARTGVMSLTGEPDGPPGKAGISYVDHSGGLAAALAVTAALVERGRTGVGRHIDLALYDVQVSMLTYLAAWNLNSDFTPGRQPSGSHPSIVPAQNFQTADGHVALFVGNDSIWKRFCSALEDARLLDERYVTGADRLAHRTELLAVLVELLAARPTQHWVGLLERVGVPCEAVNSISEALADPQIAARSLIAKSTSAAGASLRHVRGPVPLNPAAATRPAPHLGADSIAILAEVGLSRTEIDEVIDLGVLHCASGVSLAGSAE